MAIQVAHILLLQAVRQFDGRRLQEFSADFEELGSRVT